MQVADQPMLGDGQVTWPRGPPGSTGDDAVGWAGTDVSAIGILLPGLRHEDELALRRRAVEHLVRATSDASWDLFYAAAPSAHPINPASSIV